MQAVGGDLLILDQAPERAFSEIVSKINGLQSVSWNRDYEPFARARDQKVKTLLRSLKIDVITERDHLLIEPHEITKSPTPSDKNYYQVFSPFAKKWFSLLHTPEISDRIDVQSTGLQYLERLEKKQLKTDLFKITWKKLLSLPDSLEQFEKENSRHVQIFIPEGGAIEAFKRLKLFNLDSYENKRDFPYQDGTSRLAIYFKNGSLTSSQVIAFLKLSSDSSKYLREIVWREFYYSILFHVPRVENEAFLEKYRDMKWQNNESYFQAWCEGKTGYPIIDAGMRQLKQTGWMHNRVRMIVASFLTKDLLIDWRWGENYFMKMLLDGDLAPNNGGWQWASSTGCDPQPYFRIFNPLLQSQKFDPDGNYIRTYVPELAGLDAKQIHAPNIKGYPKPIVDHQKQKIKALALYQR